MIDVLECTVPKHWSKFTTCMYSTEWRWHVDSNSTTEVNKGLNAIKIKPWFVCSSNALMLIAFTWCYILIHMLFSTPCTIFLNGSPNDQLLTIHWQISWLLLSEPGLMPKSLSSKFSDLFLHFASMYY